MPALERIKPDPLPVIHPLPEYRASGQRARWYEDMKQVFQVPWMGVVTMAFSHYPQFFEALWQGFRPLARTQGFVDACATLRARTESCVSTITVERIVRRLDTIGYAERELGQIRSAIEVFAHGNFPYLLCATAARRLLEGLELGSSKQATPFGGNHRVPADAPLVLMEAHHADEQTRAVYDDIKKTLGLPFVNTDYRALARWPSYFALAWRQLKPVVGSQRYAEICNEVHRCADHLMSADVPNPGVLIPENVREAAQRDGRADEILQVARLFQWLLPGLVTNVAILRAQLAA